MYEFHYVATDKNNMTVRGTIYAEDLQKAEDVVREQGLAPLAVSEQTIHECHFVAKDKSRKTIRGTIYAEGRETAVSIIRKQGLTPIFVKVVAVNNKLTAVKDKPVPTRKNFSERLKELDNAPLGFTKNSHPVWICICIVTLLIVSFFVIQEMLIALELKQILE